MVEREPPDPPNVRRFRATVALVILLGALAFFVWYFASNWRGEDEDVPSIIGMASGDVRVSHFMSQRADHRT